MDTGRAEEARAEARDALTGGTEGLRIAADPNGAHVIDSAPKEFCPARVPCIGRPAVRLAVPVRVVAAGGGRQVGERVGEVEAVYCPQCRTIRALGREKR